MLRLALIFSSLIQAPSAWSQVVDSSLDALVEEAIAANPSIDALRSKEVSLRSRAAVSGAWPDPMIAIEYSNAPVSTFGLSDHPMAGLQFKVQQMFRPVGWSRANREVGGSKADASAHMRAESELGLALGVRRAWWTLTRSRLFRVVTEEHLALTEELLGAARIRYETGALGQHAVLRLEVLRDRLTDELGEFDRQDAELTAALTAALATSPGRVFETPTSAAPIAPPESRDWAPIAEAHRPALARYRSEQAAAEQAARVARLDGLPDPSVWAGYRVRTIQTEMDPGTDLMSFGIGVPLPSGSGRRAKGHRAAALEEASGAESMYDATLDQVVGDMAVIHARWTRAWSKTHTFDERLIPGARTTLDTTRSEFSVGRADFASLFEAEVVLLDLERTRIAAAIETHLQHAEATAVLGTDPAGDSE